MTFSERLGIVQPRTVVQKDAIDSPLRAKLWDLVRIGYLSDTDDWFVASSTNSNYLRIWVDFLERPGDEVPDAAANANGVLRKQVLEGDWYRVYDLVEFFLLQGDERVAKDQIVTALNDVLTKYVSAYRFISGEFVPITDEVQISQVEEAMTNPLAGVRTHLAKALSHLSDRESPDVANSIKESISAVESICVAIVGKKTTLGVALKKLKDAGLILHPALESGWSSMYGFSSDEGGIRHALQEKSDLRVADALYFVVTCSAFVTLLTQHAAELGIELAPVG